MKIFGKDLRRSPVLVAEIGLNHEGKFSKAKYLIDLAKKAGADAVKFQSYNLEKYCSSDDTKRYKMLKKFNFKKKQFLKIFNYCKRKKIHCFSTAVTDDYVEFLAKNTKVIKVASGDLTFKPTLSRIAKTKAKVILSSGGASLKEILNSIKYFKKISKSNLKKRLAILHCVSAYPAPINELNLNSIKFLKDRTNLTIGYSNHSPNPNVVITALNLGAKIIEVHFTDNKKNNSIRDHSLSFDYTDLKNVAEYIKNIRKILGQNNKKPQRCEKKNIKLIRKGLVASKNIKKYEIIKSNHLSFARPATYFNFDQMHKLIGKKIKLNKKKGELFKKNDFN